MAAIDLDPWGGETSRSWNSALQPRKFTTYERDSNADDEAMMRRYSRRHGRFDQPDPYGGSYDFTDPQSFNRYSYVQNDPVNFIDPLGLCTFNISLLGTGGLLDIQIDAVKRTLTEIYTAAGLELVFDKPKKASGPDLS